MAHLTLLGFALLACFALAGVLGHCNDRIRKHGPHALAWRWFTASAGWHGKAITNRGWTRPGTGKAHTDTGFAHRRWYWPRWQHALWRTRNTLAAALLAAGLLFQFRRTIDYLAVTAAAGAAYGTWRSRAWVQGYTHRKNNVKPVHIRFAGEAGIPIAAKPESWLDIPQDLSYAALTWPKNATLPKPQERQAIETGVASTLGMKGARATWQFTGPRLGLRLVPPVPSPKWVFLDKIDWAGRIPAGVAQDAIRQAILAADVNELILGVGEDGKIIKVNFKHDSPHMALSVDTGKGKSTLVRCLIPQILFRGGIAAVLDNKLVSHPSLRALPNVAYADDIDKIHFFLEWLDGELKRRAEYIRDHTDFYGNLTGSPGPRLFVILEEQNLLMNRLRSYWADRIAEDRARPKEDREFLPPVSPAIKGFENASYVGRELKVHLVFIAQRFTAEAAGGGAKGAAVRMNAGVRILAGYDEDTWKMLVGKGTSMPPPSKHEGRMQVYVKGGGLTEVQVAFFTHEEARRFAEEGPARVPEKLRHLTVFTPAGVKDPVPHGSVPHGSGGDGSAVVVTPVPQLPPPVRNWMTIRQARDAGMLPRTWTNPKSAFSTLKNRAKREGRPVPEVRGMQGTRAMYDAVELADFIERETARR
jgi:hypothetical protein